MNAKCNGDEHKVEREQIAAWNVLQPPLGTFVIVPPSVFKHLAQVVFFFGEGFRG